jgi:hypothetical protein
VKFDSEKEGTYSYQEVLEERQVSNYEEWDLLHLL